MMNFCFFKFLDTCFYFIFSMHRNIDDSNLRTAGIVESNQSRIYEYSEFVPGGNIMLFSIVFLSLVVVFEKLRS